MELGFAFGGGGGISLRGVISDRMNGSLMGRAIQFLPLQPKTLVRNACCRRIWISSADSRINARLSTCPSEEPKCILSHALSAALLGQITALVHLSKALRHAGILKCVSFLLCSFCQLNCINLHLFLSPFQVRLCSGFNSNCTRIFQFPTSHSNFPPPPKLPRSSNRSLMAWPPYLGSELFPFFRIPQVGVNIKRESLTLAPTCQYLTPSL